MALREELEWQLEDYLRILFLHKWQVLIVAFIFGVLTATHMAQLPNIYTTSARILIETNPNRLLNFQTAGPVRRPWDRTFLQTEYQVIASRAVLSRVVEELHLAAFAPFSHSKDPVGSLRGTVQVNPVRGTKLVDIKTTGIKPELIARIANSVADNYARLNLERQRNMTTGGADWLRQEVDRVSKKMRVSQLRLQEFRERYGTLDFGEKHYSSVLQRLQGLHASLSKTRENRIEAETKFREKHPKLQELRAKEQEFQLALFDQEQRALELSRLGIQYNTLLREAKTSESIYNILLTRLEELSVQEGMQSNNVQIVDYALVPGRPIGPNRSNRVASFALLGFLVGYGLALLREKLTKIIRTRREFERLLEIPFLGHTSLMRMEARAGQPPSLITDSHSVIAESLRSIRTTLEFLLPSEQHHFLLVTSALPEEGKSFLSMNLALALHELGRKVLLVDGDLRRPTLHQAMKIELEPGLSSYLQEQAGMGELIQISAHGNELPVVAAGLTPQQPTELLVHPRLRELITFWKQEYQYVIMDTPPILAVADTSAIAGLADGILFLVRAERTHQEAMLAGKQRIVDVGGKIIGGILNGVRHQKERGYRYYYYKRYHQGEKPRRQGQVGAPKKL